MLNTKKPQVKIIKHHNLKPYKLSTSFSFNLFNRSKIRFIFLFITILFITKQRTQKAPKQINESVSPCHSQDQIEFQAFMSLLILKQIFAFLKVEIGTEVSTKATSIQADTGLSTELAFYSLYTNRSMIYACNLFEVWLFSLYPRII